MDWGFEQYILETRPVSGITLSKEGWARVSLGVLYHKHVNILSWRRPWGRGPHTLWQGILGAHETDENWHFSTKHLGRLKPET